MKLLLTSAGLTNKSLVDAVIELAGRQTFELVIAVIPTASMVEHEDKSWLLDEISKLHELGWKEFLITDIAGGYPKDKVMVQLESADVIYATGGITYFLANAINKFGVDDFKKLLQEKVYIGSSAGSQVVSTHLTREDALLVDVVEDFDSYSCTPPLNLFDWYIKPHYLSPLTPEKDETWAKSMASRVNYPIYFLDDQSAVKVDDERIEVISEGEWCLLG